LRQNFNTQPKYSLQVEPLLNKTEVEGEGRFELLLIPKVIKGHEITVLFTEILDWYYILVKPTSVEYRFTFN